MRYQLQRKGDDFLHVETDQPAGYLLPLKNGKRFSVHRALTEMSERDKVGVATSIDEALDLLTEYYIKHPPQWKRIRAGRYDRCDGYSMSTVFSKWTFYGVFNVKQNETGQWVVSRCTDALLREGQLAVFPTSEVARHVADLHERDGISKLPAINDGYSWDDPNFLHVRQGEGLHR